MKLILERDSNSPKTMTTAYHHFLAYYVMVLRDENKIKSSRIFYENLKATKKDLVSKLKFLLKLKSKNTAHHNFFETISEDPLSKILSFLSKEDVKGLKVTSLNLAIQCLLEMEKHGNIWTRYYDTKTQTIRMNERFPKHLISDKKKLLNFWANKYDIPFENLVLLYQTKDYPMIDIHHPDWKFPLHLEKHYIILDRKMCSFINAKGELDCPYTPISSITKHYYTQRVTICCTESGTQFSDSYLFFVEKNIDQFLLKKSLKKHTFFLFKLFDPSGIYPAPKELNKFEATYIYQNKTFHWNIDRP